MNDMSNTELIEKLEKYLTNQGCDINRRHILYGQAMRHVEDEQSEQELEFEDDDSILDDNMDEEEYTQVEE